MEWRALEEWVAQVLARHGGEVWPNEFDAYYDTNITSHLDALQTRIGYRLRGATGACIGFDGMVAFRDGTVAPLQIKYTGARYLGSSLGSMWRETFLLQRELGVERVRLPVLVTTAHKLPRHQKNSLQLFAMPQLLEWQQRFAMPFSAPEAVLAQSKRLRAALRSIRAGESTPEKELIHACKYQHADVVLALSPCHDMPTARKCVRLILMNCTPQDAAALLLALCPSDSSALARYVLLQAARFRTLEVHMRFSERHPALPLELSGRLSLHPHLQRLYPSATATRSDRVAHACFVGCPSALPADADPFDLSCGYADAAAEGHIAILAKIDSLGVDVDACSALCAARSASEELCISHIMRTHFTSRPVPPSCGRALC